MTVNTSLSTAQICSIISNLFVQFGKLIKDIFLFLSVSSIFVGITGFFQTFAGCIILGISPSIRICAVAFLVTFSVYSLNKLTDINEDTINMPERTEFISNRRNVIFFCALGAYIISIVLTFIENYSAIPVLFIPLAVNSIYSSRLIPGVPRLKDVPIMKNVSVAVSWALGCTLLPVVHMSCASKMVIGLTLYFMVVKVFINTVLYDVRDAEGDWENGIRTMPTLLGTRKTTSVLLTLNSTLFILLTFLDEAVRLMVVGMIIYGYCYILYFRVRRKPLILDLFADGEWMFACILFILYT